MERTKAAVTRPIVSFQAAPMARLPEEVKRAKIDAKKILLATSLSLGKIISPIPKYTPITIWTMPSPVAHPEEQLPMITMLW